VKTLAAISAASLLLVLPIVGCRTNEGPAEETGRKVDEAIDKLTHPNEGPLEKSGRKVDEAVEDLRH
jgi:hypothetical protein